MNLIVLLGAVISLGASLTALVLVIKALAAIPNWRRRNRAVVEDGRTTHSLAVEARHLYVPGRITRLQAAALLCLFPLALGGAVTLAGLEIHQEYALVTEPRQVAIMAAKRVAPDRLQLACREASGLTQTPEMQGTRWAVFGDFISFDEKWRMLGLGVHQRITALESFARAEDVLMNQPTARHTIRDTTPLFRFLRRYADSLTFVSVTRHWSPPQSREASELPLIAGPQGYHFRER